VDESGLAETVALLQDKGGRVHTYIADVADRRRMFALARQVTANLDQADLLINNACVTLKPQYFEHISDEKFDWLSCLTMRRL
jgi:NADP-dependent 3-hydroxy acid dehydrogenase YdfG